VDFLCKQAKLVIELDGESHVGTSAQSSDRQRDLDLAALGYRILRVSNRELQNNLDGVLQTILERVEG
jgi:very-short-patch-repair endonuclease